MPARRAPDQGVKPFEIRTGVGGLPTLGGMFRSGDPATTPPHKFHLLVNMRKTPGGTITRPGLTPVFDTGIEECIDGLTEDAGLQGAALMLYPGADPAPGNGTSGRNIATFRAIFPDQSDDYSEFVITLFGPAAQGVPANSPVLGYAPTAGGGPIPDPAWLSRPFIFRGQAVQFALVDRNGVDTVALLGMELPGRSNKAADNCVRANSIDTGSLPCDDQQGTLFPFQWPVGSVGVLTYFDNPFGAGPWRPDASSRDSGSENIDLVLTRQERSDDVLTQTTGVQEVLYFVARQGAGPIARRLVRWDGAVQTTEFSSIPNDLRPSLGDQPYGPFLGNSSLNGTAEEWAAFRAESGVWSVIDGAGWTIGAGADEYFTQFDADRGLSWGGKGHLVTYGTHTSGGLTTHANIHAHGQRATDFDGRRSTITCKIMESSSDAGLSVDAFYDAVVCGTRAYAIFRSGDEVYVSSGDFTTPTAGNTDTSYKVMDSGASGFPDNNPPIWIQVVGERVYVGGQRTNGGDHFVDDVTNTAAVFNVYTVGPAEQTEDEQSERYSRGALTAVPNDSTGGEGFQAS